MFSVLHNQFKYFSLKEDNNFYFGYVYLKCIPYNTVDKSV